jgi:hypothetical protein
LAQHEDLDRRKLALPIGADGRQAQAVLLQAPAGEAAADPMAARAAALIGGAIVQGDRALACTLPLDPDDALIQRRDQPGADVDLLDVGTAAGPERDDQQKS